MDKDIKVDKPEKKRKTIAIVCAVLSCLCFVVHYAMLKGTCDAAADMIYAYCVKGTGANYWVETFLVQLGNAGIVFTLLWYFGWPMIQTMVAERKHKIERDIEESNRLKAEAEQVYNEVMTKTVNLSEETTIIRRSYETSARAESAKIVEDAKLQAERMISDANASFELQANVTKRNFEHEVINEAIDKARDEISHRLATDPALRDKLIEQSIAALEF